MLIAKVKDNIVKKDLKLRKPNLIFKRKIYYSRRGIRSRYSK